MPVKTDSSHLPKATARAAIYPAVARQRAFPGGHPPPVRAGFTLLEMVAVLTVVMILACLVFSSALSDTTQQAIQQETASLQSFGDALHQSVLRNGAIPAATNWATTIATELGADTGTVLTNACQNARVFVVDPNFQVGTNGSGLPYTQSNAGSVVTTNGNTVIPPINPRMMILSTLGASFPGALASTVQSGTNFDAIWTVPAGKLPKRSALANWGGATNDLRVQRITLSGSFVRLLLFNYASADAGRYATHSPVNPAVVASNVPPAGVVAYFIQGTALQLYNGSGIPDSEQILNRDQTFVYDQGIWRGSTSLNPSNSLADVYSGAVFAQTLSLFASSPANLNATGGATPASVVSAVSNYLSAYNLWAAAGFPSSGATNSAVKTAGTQMQTAMQQLAATFGTGQCR